MVVRTRMCLGVDQELVATLAQECGISAEAACEFPRSELPFLGELYLGDEEVLRRARGVIRETCFVKYCGYFSKRHNKQMASKRAGRSACSTLGVILFQRRLNHLACSE